ncbi:MAG: hypothetical protein QOJ96_425 [Alphaproteobacteria bacterium]|jgi:hypothetical protein|nr:hypothetical protein [Alphaproteobacteria bacterium]
MDRTAGPGRPGTVDGQVGGALGGAAPSLGRARCLAARGGYVNPASKGCLTQHPWRLPPLHPLARFARDWQTSDALRRENAKVWLFESMDQKFKTKRFLNLSRSFAGRGRREAPGEGPGTASAESKNLSGRNAFNASNRPESHRSHLAHCLAPHPKPSLSLSSGGASRRPVGYGFDLSPRKSGERLEAGQEFLATGVIAIRFDA